MATKEDLDLVVKSIFADQWTFREGRTVPDPENLKLNSNDAVNLDATLLYADLDGSTQLVDSFKPFFAAGVYKAYLACAARIINEGGGSVTAYDGDRVMAVFLGDSKNSSAAKVALKINYAVLNIINPAIVARFPNAKYVLKHAVGIDTSKIMVARIGVRNDNDLVWVGRAANYAAKLSSRPGSYSYITADVFKNLTNETKYGGKDQQIMWNEQEGQPMGSLKIYRSGWTWKV